MAVTVWELRHRMLTARVRTLLSGDDDDMFRLAAAAYVLLSKHRLTRRGRCRQCCRGLRRRQTCVIYQAFAVAMEQPINMVVAWMRDH